MTSDNTALIPNDSLHASRVNWGDDGSIVFETNAMLALLPAGGTLRLLRKAIDAEQPRLTPDGRGILYVDNRRSAKLVYYDLALDSAFVLFEGAAEAQLLPTGQLIYGSSVSGLYTVQFNAARHAVEGTPSPVVLDMKANGGIAPYVVTRSGTLVYRVGVDAESRVVLRQPNGKTDTLPLAPKVLSYARFSPDGRSLALTIGAARGSNRHTAIYDFNVGTLTRITQEGGAHSPVWSPDGKRIAFTAESPTTDAEDIFVQPVDQSAPPMAVVHLPNDQHANAWPVDSILVFSNNAGARTLGAAANGGSADIVNPTTKSPAKPFLRAAWGESDPAISPDGKWAAFTSGESGAPEIHVRPFAVDGAGGNWKVSSGGGQRARWSADGRTIFYQSADAKAIRATKVAATPSFTVGTTETVMQGREFGTAWDLDRATGRIVVTETVLDAGARIVVMQHWLDQFRRKKAAKP